MLYLIRPIDGWIDLTRRPWKDIWFPPAHFLRRISTILIFSFRWFKVWNMNWSAVGTSHRAYSLHTLGRIIHPNRLLFPTKEITILPSHHGFSSLYSLSFLILVSSWHIVCNVVQPNVLRDGILDIFDTDIPCCHTGTHMEFWKDF